MIEEIILQNTVRGNQHRLAFFIEYNELDSDEYISKKDYAMKIYQREKVNVVIMTNKDLFDIPSFLMPKLKSIKQH